MRVVLTMHVRVTCCAFFHFGGPALLRGPTLAGGRCSRGFLVPGDVSPLPLSTLVVRRDRKKKKEPTKKKNKKKIL